MDARHPVDGRAPAGPAAALEPEGADGGFAQHHAGAERLRDLLDPEGEDDGLAGELLAAVALGEEHRAVVGDDAEGEGACRTPRLDGAQRGEGLPRGGLVVLPVGKDRVAEIAVDVAAMALDEGPHAGDPGLEPAQRGPASDLLVERRVALDVSEEEPAPDLAHLVEPLGLRDADRGLRKVELARTAEAGPDVAQLA